MSLATEARPVTGREALVRVGKALAPEEFAAIRRAMLLEHCKWDAQVGDVGVLASFPLVLERGEWEELAGAAGRLARELIEVEDRILKRPELLRRLGLPRRVGRLLEGGNLSRGGPRIMRFDFHPTDAGWALSEVNSDVPGGYTESASFSELVGAACGLEMAGNPGKKLAEAIAQSREGNGPVLLLAAAGYVEDQQVVAYQAGLLRERGVEAVVGTMNQLGWEGGRAVIRHGEKRAAASAVVRFFQGEWLSGLPRGIDWEPLVAGGKTVVINPPRSIVGESKRLPLVWEELGMDVSTWRRYLPETRDPRHAPWRRDEGWVLKGAYSNNGDAVCIRERMAWRAWRRVGLEVLLRPGVWVAQRRFEPAVISTPLGPMKACVGVYVLDGEVVGAYGRLAKGLVVDYAAMDAAVLIAPGAEV